MFETAVTEAYANAFALVGEAATYTSPGGGSSIETLAKIDRGMIQQGSLAQASQPTVLVSLPRADVPAPRRGATVTIGGASYVLERREQDNGWKVICSAREVTP